MHEPEMLKLLEVRSEPERGILRRYVRIASKQKLFKQHSKACPAEGAPARMTEHELYL
jgi:hypothetical protein